jgi:Fe-coproporphyrin III synthase
MGRLAKRELATKSIDLFFKKPSFKSIMWLNFAVTYRCNSRCIMCSIWKKYKQKPELMKEELSIEQIEDILESTYLKNLHGVSFTGGELFLRKDIVDIIGLFINKYPKAIFGIASNGLNPKLTVNKIKEIQNKFNPKHLSISLSLDGVFEKHDKVRGIDGAFEFLDKTINILQSETDVNVGIDFTITPWNYEELLEVYKYTKDKNIKFLTCFAHQSEAYYDNKDTTFKWTEDSLQKVETSLEEIVRDKVRNESLFNKLIDPYAFFLSNCSNYQKEYKISQNCYSGTHSLFLDPYGNIYPCIILNQKMGNIKDGGFDKIWTSSEAEKIRDQINFGGCSCWVACEAVTSTLRNLNYVKWNLKNKFYTKL